VEDQQPVRLAVDEIAVHFADLEDPRSTVNQRHPLVSVVVIAVMAVLGGANGPTGIARWAALKADLLKKVLPLPGGVPRKDVFRRVLCLLNPAAFQAAFADWLAALQARAAERTGVTQPLYSVDGKTLRRSHSRAAGLGALHSVSVWASQFGLTLAQVATDEKSNEITAIPELLRLVDLSGAIVTIDALGTQKAIARQVVDGGGDYVLALKGNQETLHQGVVGHFDTLARDGFEGVDVRRHRTEEQGHGRQETRLTVQVPAPQTLPGFKHWKGLRTIGMTTLFCVRDGRETVETRYYVSSLPMGVKRLAQVVRGHWSIENACHWSLDFTYREDESRIRDAAMRENFAWLRRFTLSLLKQHPGQGSVSMKRQSCGWSDEFLMQVLTGKTS
jgi:predicted transposase YbfD/YdcC